MAPRRKSGEPMVSGAKIREHRESLKQKSQGRQGSQSWVAGQIGAHFTSVSDWERGINQPSSRHLRALADVLGVRIEDLYADDDDEESSMHAHGDMAADLTRVLRQLIREEIRSVA